MQVELILSHVLKVKRLELYLQFERVLRDEELNAIRTMVQRRGKHEPLQHILETVEFCGLTLNCSPAALIPRPETELLVESVVEFLKNKDGELIYDVGTGSGAIALSVLKQVPQFRCIATDASADALALAKTNHERYPDLQVEWRQASLLEGNSEQAMLVMANLPYLTTKEMEALSPEVKADPSLALHGGKDGADLIRQLILQAAPLTSHLFLEIGIAQASDLQSFANNNGFPFSAVKKDLTGRDRFLFLSKNADL